MSTSKTAMIVPAVAGILAGLASSFLFSARGESRAAATDPGHAVSAPAAQTVYAPVIVTPAHGNETVDDLRKRIDELEKQNRATGAKPSASTDPAALEEQRRATIQRHDALVKAHREQPVDPSWGPSTGALVRTDLEKIAESSTFKVIDADCKTTSCAGTLEWPSFGAATSEWRKVLHHGFQANCSRQVTLPDPPDPNTPYRATVVLDCESWRAEAR